MSAIFRTEQGRDESGITKYALFFLEKLKFDPDFDITSIEKKLSHHMVSLYEVMITSCRFLADYVTH